MIHSNPRSPDVGVKPLSGSVAYPIRGVKIEMTDGREVTISYIPKHDSSFLGISSFFLSQTKNFADCCAVASKALVFVPCVACENTSAWAKKVEKILGQAKAAGVCSSIDETAKNFRNKGGLRELVELVGIITYIAATFVFLHPQAPWAKRVACLGAVVDLGLKTHDLYTHVGKRRLYTPDAGMIVEVMALRRPSRDEDDHFTVVQDSPPLLPTSAPAGSPPSPTVGLSPNAEPTLKDCLEFRGDHYVLKSEHKEAGTAMLLAEAQKDVSVLHLATARKVNKYILGVIAGVVAVVVAVSAWYVHQITMLSARQIQLLTAGLGVVATSYGLAANYRMEEGEFRAEITPKVAENQPLRV